MGSLKRNRLVPSLAASALGLLGAFSCGLVVLPIHERNDVAEGGIDATASVDAGAAEAAVDAGNVIGADAPVTIRCGSQTCVGATGERCCLGTSDAGDVTYACFTRTCPLGTRGIACDDPSDCAPSETCCGHTSDLRIYCDPAPCLASTRTMCEPNAPAPCPGDAACTEAGPDFPGYFACQ
jgi:hypothetical protein